jgi:hypothetical protein
VSERRIAVLDVVIERAGYVPDLPEGHRDDRDPVIVPVLLDLLRERQRVVENLAAEQSGRTRDRVGDQE